MDGVVSPATAIELGRLGGLGVLNLEGLWSATTTPTRSSRRSRSCRASEATRAHAGDLRGAAQADELMAQRIREIKAAGVLAAASLTPQRVRAHYEAVLEAGLDVLVIQGTVVSAEHVSSLGRAAEPQGVHRLGRRSPCVVGGCASYQTALHLMRTGAAGVLVGVGPGAACTTRGVLGVGVPQATAIADAAAARVQHLLETGALLSTSSPTAACAPAATSPRPSPAAPTR